MQKEVSCKKYNAKNKTGTALRITQKNLQDEELPHKLLLTRRQKSQTRNVFVNNMLTDIKLSKAQMSKIIQSSGFLSIMSVDLGKKKY